MTSEPTDMTEPTTDPGAGERGKLLAHGFREGEQVRDEAGREWSVVTVQNNVAMVTNGWMTTWFGVEELALAARPDGAR